MSPHTRQIDGERDLSEDFDFIIIDQKKKMWEGELLNTEFSGLNYKYAQQR